MKIAVPTRDNMVDNHFGHCDHYTIFTINDGVVKMKEILPSPQGCGCKSGIALVLRQKGVQVMLAGNMGEGARNVLESNNIEVIRGQSGNIDELVAAYLAGKVSDSGEGCSHHECNG
ncbi:MAG: NifB/NifX family molybdenum-iron cluster-binding protein [Bacteroidaceae bacterium]|nr:NifB/NifX family molybdenum-iron cluster-binding protein [Bacteroidaceae bacterium]